MAKAPLTREVMLGGHAVTLVGSPESVHATLYSEKISPEQLRNLADELDRLQSAVDVFFGQEEYAINYTPNSGNYAEDSVVIKTHSMQAALLEFSFKDLGKAKSVYNRTTQETFQLD